jgi:hypothetical protein
MVKNIQMKFMAIHISLLALSCLFFISCSTDPLAHIASSHTIEQTQSVIHTNMPLADLLNFLKCTPILVEGQTRCVLANGDLWISEQRDLNGTVRVKNWNFKEDVSEKEVEENWEQNYYKHPSPQNFEAEVWKLQKAGSLSNIDLRIPLAAFFAQLFAANESSLQNWMSIVYQLPEEDRKVFIVALRFANTPATEKILSELASKKESFSNYCKKMINFPLAMMPDFKTLTHHDPMELDGAWGSFFATGDKDYALAVIRCAATSEKESDADTRNAARWSLKSLCITDPNILKIKNEFYQTASPKERKSLDELFSEKNN